MKSIVSRRFCHFWTYVLMAFVLLELVEFAYSHGGEWSCDREQPYILCKCSFDNAVNALCPKGYDLELNPLLYYQCCYSGFGCTFDELKSFCPEDDRRTQIPDIICGHGAFLAAVRRTCNYVTYLVNGLKYNLNLNPTLEDQCCNGGGCTPLDLATVCNPV